MCSNKMEITLKNYLFNLSKYFSEVTVTADGLSFFTNQKVYTVEKFSFIGNFFQLGNRCSRNLVFFRGLVGIFLFSCKANQANSETDWILVFLTERPYLVQDLKLILKLTCKPPLYKCQPAVYKCQPMAYKCQLAVYKCQP